MDVTNLTVFNYDAKTIKPERERKLRGQLPEVVVRTLSSALDEARKSYQGTSRCTTRLFNLLLAAASPITTSKNLQVQIAGLWRELFAAPALKVVDAHLDDAAFPANEVLASALESHRAVRHFRGKPRSTKRSSSWRRCTSRKRFNSGGWHSSISPTSAVASPVACNPQTATYRACVRSS